MDFSCVNEIFHFYEPEVNLHWLQAALEQMNSAALVDLSIATVTCGFLVGFYIYRRSQKAKTKSPPSNDAEKIHSGDLQEYHVTDRLRGVELFPENTLTSLADDSELLTDDASSSSTSSFAQSDDNANPLLWNISMPEKDVSDSKEYGDAIHATADGPAKMVYKKMIQDGVNARLKLLLAEKKIYSQMRKMHSLKRSLLESSVGNCTHHSSLNKTSTSISRRKSFFDADCTEKSLLKCSSAVAPGKSHMEEDATRVQLITLKESLREMINEHANELSSLYERIAEKREHGKKMEAMMKEIDSLCEKMEKKNDKDKELTVEESNNNMINMHDKTSENNIVEQGEEKKCSYGKNSVNQLQSHSIKKNLFKNYDNEQELSTILEKTNEDAENSLILLNDIPTLQCDLKSNKKSWSRSSTSTPRKSPGEQPVPT